MTLLDICELIVDCPHSTAKDEGQGYPLIRTPNIGKGRLILDDVHRVSKDVYDARNQRAVPQEDDLILAREAPVGNVAIIQPGQKVCLGQRTVLIRPDKSKVNSNYLVYNLLSPIQQHNLTSSANGATVAHLNMGIIRNLKMELPPREVQDKIAGILSKYDELIENSRKQIALLEEAAQRLYREWFVDFRFPGSTSHNSLPQDWQEVNLAKIGEFKRGKNLIVGDAIPGNIAVIAGGLTPSCYHNAANTSAPVITVSGSGANAGYTAIHLHDVWASDCSYLDRTKTDHIFFIYCFLKSNPALLKNQQKGAAQPHVYAKDINAFRIVLPPIDLLQKFEDIAATKYQQIGVLRDFISTNISARDALLPKLMSGELKV
jgi:type I restriction enzyme S subunit